MQLAFKLEINFFPAFRVSHCIPIDPDPVYFDRVTEGLVYLFQINADRGRIVFAVSERCKYPDGAQRVF